MFINAYRRAKIVSSLYEECLSDNRVGFFVSEKGEAYFGSINNTTFVTFGFWDSNLLEKEGKQIYFGKSLNGLRHGIGIQYFDSGDYLKGNWYEGELYVQFKQFKKQIFQASELNLYSMKWKPLNNLNFDIDKIRKLLNNKLYEKLLNQIKHFNNDYFIIEFLNGYLLVQKPFELDNIIRTIYNYSSFSSKSQKLFNEKEMKPLLYEGFISKEKYNNQVIEILKYSITKFYEDNQHYGLLGNAIAIIYGSGIYYGNFRVDKNYLIARDGRGIMVKFDGIFNEGIWNKEVLSYIIYPTKKRKLKQSIEVYESSLNLII